MSYIKIFSFKKYYIFSILLVLYFSEINCKNIEISPKLLFQHKYNLNNNFTNLILKDSEIKSNVTSPMDYFFDIIRKNFDNLFNNKKFDLSRINSSCIQFLNSTFVNYTGKFSSSISNYYIAKMFEDSSKNKNDLGLYNQCFIKTYKFNRSVINLNQTLTEYYISIIDKTKNTEPLYIRSLYCALNSVLAASNTLFTSVGFHDDAMAMGSGNTVTLPMLAAPCRASLHQKNFLIPMRGMAGLSSSISMAFSSSVSREHKSTARSCALNAVFL